jgi:mannosyltransferase OCH1-like enzyme
MIPLNIFQTWHSKDLAPIMKQVIDNIKINNPEFTHYLFDLEECREFLRSNFDSKVLRAYDKLKPSAYKSDLWRYCVLYTYGGIYLDVKFMIMNDFKLINITNDEYFCRDMHPEETACNGLIIVNKGNETLLKCINQIVINVNNKYYGNGSLDPTGPMLLTSCLNSNEKNKLEILRLERDIHIIFEDIEILRRYPEYRYEQSLFQATEYYDIMWKNKDIYRAPRTTFAGSGPSSRPARRSRRKVLQTNPYYGEC